MEEEIKFEKIGDKYKITLTQLQNDSINGMLAAMSNGIEEEYSKEMNKDIKNIITARYVSSLFFITHPNVDLSLLGFVLIEVVTDNRIIVISVGKVTVAENKVELVSGVLYKE